MLGLDEKISAGLNDITCRVKIGAEGVSPDKLRELAEWGDRHSPIACTTRSMPSFSLEVEVV
jgi:ferredoxin